jgi:hypothetical protein
MEHGARAERVREGKRDGGKEGWRERERGRKGEGERGRRKNKIQ